MPPNTPYPNSNTGKLCRETPAAATTNPPPKHTADANIAARGPTRSSQAPNVAAESPRKTIATLNTQPIVLSFQFPDAVSLPPTRRANGRLNTLNAYACPIDKWMASAAGGTSQREYSGPATECARSRNGIAENLLHVV